MIGSDIKWRVLQDSFVPVNAESNQLHLNYDDVITNVRPELCVAFAQDIDVN